MSKTHPGAAASSSAALAGAAATQIRSAERISFEGVAPGTEYRWGGVRLLVLDAAGHIPVLEAKGRQWLLRNTNIAWSDRLSAGSETALRGDPANVYVRKVDTGGIDEIIRNMKGTQVQGKMLVDHGPLWGVHSPSRVETRDGRQAIVNEWVADGMKLRREILPTADGARFQYVLEALSPETFLGKVKELARRLAGAPATRSAYYAPHIKVPLDLETRIQIDGNPKLWVDPGSVKNLPGVDPDVLHEWPHVGGVDLSRPLTPEAYHVKTHIVMPDDSPVAKMTLIQGALALEMTWDRERLPHAGNWFNNGGENFGVSLDGAPAPACVDAGLEPTNGFSDDPNHPMNRQVPTLRPGERTTFWYELAARNLNDLGER